MRMPLQDELAYAVRHVESACRQRRGEGGERRFELVGSRLWPGIETLVDALARAGVRGAELNFMPRVDELLARRDAVVRCLPVLARQGLALRLYGMGVENFSPAENMRLNKGVAAGQVHEAAGFMRETAERWPRQFRLPSGGLSMILFTPWTTIEDLLINIHHIERCPLIDRSFAIGRRLQLFPGLPITALAAKDGLLAAADEPFYNSGCITSADRKEIPWRFRRPEVEVLWRLARRLSSNHGGVPADDPERRRIDALLAGRRRPLTEDRRDPFTVFRRAVEIAASWTGSRRRRRRALSPGPPGNGMMS
ncbi:MAG: hypothetical protein HY926_09570 [Elusimicrobia bacterium]|nr:hypothetical protein [Elusimicrobiota bacterium]